MGPKLLIIFCLAGILAVGEAETKVSDDQQRARLPEFLTELDLASLEASEEDIDSLKKVVKRLAPAKNGEYLMYQGVMGQPGVDFPVLTTIPATTFSCRGLKGGYYADLETNCQVFHICDNGRKISFLCPNGTIFQQSQLICDWWFKVDCGKSAELYEQSAEQLAEDERKRAEAKKMNSEFHRASGKSTGQVYYQTQNQNVDYDGRQNGRTNPFSQNNNNNNGENLAENLTTINNQQNGRNGDQFVQGQLQTAINPAQNSRGNTQYNQNYNNNYNQQSQQSDAGQNNLDQQQSSRGNFNNYNNRNNIGATKSAQNSYDYYGSGSNSNSQRDEKTNYRNGKALNEARNNLNELTSTANPFKEYQQPAESAAFATSRNNRYNKSFQYNQLANYYSANQLSSTEKYQNEGLQSSSGQNGIKDNVSSKKDAGNTNNFPSVTFTPIYKPRTTAAPFQSDAGSGVTTLKSYVNTDIYRHNTATQTSYSNSETVTANPYQSNTTPSQRYEFKDNSRTNYQQNSQAQGPRNTHTSQDATNTRITSTQKPYVNTDTYRPQNSAAGFTSVTENPTTWTSSYETATTPTTTTNNLNTETSNFFTFTTDNYDRNTVTGSRWNTVTEVTPSAIDFHSFSSTQRPGAYGNEYQDNAVTSRNLSPYDTSVTYKNGKISSTLGPYLPFTKNYAFTTTTTTTTGKPPVYTATVPTIPDNRRRGPGVSTTETPAYFHTGTTPVKGIQDTGREHAIEMLQSLQDLEATAPTNDFKNGSRIGLIIPPSSGPSTLHTLALYFATASDNFDSNETTTDTAVRIDNVEDEEIVSTTENVASAELPTSILTQHTIDSYADLFSVKSVDNSTKVGGKIGVDYTDVDYSSKDDDDDGEDDDDNDLDLQQSQGPVTGDNQRNNPKLRELAQVFTHALSAYLHDPEAFRKVLTEIRPTEPPTTVSTETTESTTIYPTTQDDYPSATKEKDEVLDFSDVTKASRRKKLTTPYPTTGQAFTTPIESTYQTYYTTSTPNFIDESLNEAQSSDFRSSDDVKRNNFAHEVNHAFINTNYNELNSFNVDVSGPSASGGPSAPNQYDSYVPIGPPSSENRFGGFQNNSANTPEPYGKGVKPADSTPIGDNYVPESTPASYVRSADNGNTVTTSSDVTSTFEDNEVISSTQEPFRINYYESSTTDLPRRNINDESLVTAGSVYSTFRNNYNDLWLNEKPTNPGATDVAETTTADYTSSTVKGDDSVTYNDHSSTNQWTASPTVTRLWETTVFLDPKHINQGLTASGVGQTDAFSSTGSQTFATTPISNEDETLVTDASGLGKTNQYNNGDGNTSPSWKWLPNENDSPTAFTLLPTVYSTENTATPAPTYTTHSSIITTITSSVSSSAKPTRQEKSYHPLRINVSAFNVTENEIIRAQEMFGNLNATSTNTLMRVMKQADNNSTVRQLVLLLISHCKGPMNKTMEEEKEQLLDALLRMPVNEFSSEESRDIIDGINKLQLPIGRASTVQHSTPTTTQASITTYRSRRGRKFRTSMKSSTSSETRSVSGDNSESPNSLGIEAGSSSDNRALELLRSLYTIAAKWG